MYAVCVYVLFLWWPMSVVHRPSVRACARQQLFKQLLLTMHLANCVKTSQRCSFYKTLPKLLKEFNSLQNSGCHGNRNIFFKNLFKNYSQKPTMLRALILDMQHHLVVLYEDCWNYAPMVKKGLIKVLSSLT